MGEAPNEQEFSKPRVVLSEGDLDQITDFDGTSISRTHHIVLLADDQGRFVGASQPALELLGYTHEGLTELTVAAITAPFDRDAHPVGWDHFVRAGEDAGYHRVITATGQIVLLHYHSQMNVIPGVHLSQLRPPNQEERATFTRP